MHPSTIEYRVTVDLDVCWRMIQNYIVGRFWLRSSPTRYATICLSTSAWASDMRTSSTTVASCARSTVKVYAIRCEEMGLTYKELSDSGTLRKKHKLGPWSSYLRLLPK